MSLQKELVRYDWKILEEQPLYVKSARREHDKYGYSIEVAVDRSSKNEGLRGEVFKIYGKNIDDVKENSDIVISISEEDSYFIQQQFGSIAMIFVESAIEAGNSYSA